MFYDAEIICTLPNKIGIVMGEVPRIHQAEGVQKETNEIMKVEHTPKVTFPCPVPDYSGSRIFGDVDEM